MKFPSWIHSFKNQLIICLSFLIIVIFVSTFITFVHIAQIEQLVAQEKLSPIQFRAITDEINLIKQVSFAFIVFTSIFISTALIQLIVTSSFSLHLILEGIKKLDAGDLTARIILYTHDEFETIAQFFNKAAEHLESKQNELIEAKANVEHIVVERTDELSSEKNKLALTLANTTDGVIAIDLQGRISLMNTAMELLSGYSKDETIGQSIESLISLHSKEELIPFKDYCPTEKNSRGEIKFEIKNIRITGKDKKEKFVNLASGHITEGAKTNLGWILTFHDVTDEHYLEQMKLDFVSMAAHELRTPLTSIRGYLSLFLHDNKDKFDATQSMFLNRVQFSTTQLLALIENLLSVSKIERGVFVVSTKPTDWVALVKHTVEEFVDRARDKKVTLTFEQPKEAIALAAVDALRITEVISNLLGNAINYTREDGTVRVYLEQKDGTIVTHITDTGEGIPKEALAHLFKKFFRVSGVLEQGSKGTGLGLFIAKSIVDMHKGTIWVESELGKGSTFSFSIPVASQNL